jgi:hypothetical protein
VPLVWKCLSIGLSGRPKKGKGKKKTTPVVDKKTDTACCCLLLLAAACLLANSVAKDNCPPAPVYCCIALAALPNGVSYRVKRTGISLPVS